MSNVFKTALLLAVLTAMLVLIGGAIGGRNGMLIALIFVYRSFYGMRIASSDTAAKH